MNLEKRSWRSSILAIFEFELRRAMTVGRIIWWCVLAFFPVVIVALVLTVPGARANLPAEVWQIFLFVLIPMLISMLGTFMWTASAISSELEGQSWIYLAVRPGGRAAVLLGKYLVAITWVLPATLLGATLAVFLVWLADSSLTETGNAWRTWFAIIRLCSLSVPAYAAIYLILGTIFTKRSMVVAVAYTLVFELAVSFVPALINKLTIQYRLRSLFLQWVGIDLSNVDNAFTWMDLTNGDPAWLHVTVLIGYTAVLTLFASWLVKKREYLVSAAADVA